MARADAGGVKAVPRRVVACAIRALATRGRRRGHAARGSCRCRPLKVAIQFIQSRHAVPDDEFCNRNNSLSKAIQRILSEQKS